MIAAIARAVPDRECVVHGEDRRSYRDFVANTNRFANVLHAHGLGLHRDRADLAGFESGQDHLALYLHNGIEFLEANVGAFAARVAPFNVNYRYVDDELVALFADQHARAVVFHAAFAPIVERIAPRLPDLELLVQVGDDSGQDLARGCALVPRPAPRPALHSPARGPVAGRSLRAVHRRDHGHAQGGALASGRPLRRRSGWDERAHPSRVHVARTAGRGGQGSGRQAEPGHGPVHARARRNGPRSRPSRTATP